MLKGSTRNIFIHQMHLETRMHRRIVATGSDSRLSFQPALSQQSTPVGFDHKTKTSGSSPSIPGATGTIDTASSKDASSGEEFLVQALPPLGTNSHNLAAKAHNDRTPKQPSHRLHHKVPTVTWPPNLYGCGMRVERIIITSQ
jgi:hypothetical protein